MMDSWEQTGGKACRELADRRTHLDRLPSHAIHMSTLQPGMNKEAFFEIMQPSVVQNKAISSHI